MAFEKAVMEKFMAEHQWVMPETALPPVFGKECYEDCQKDFSFRKILFFEFMAALE